MSTGTPMVYMVVGDLGSAKELLPVSVELAKRNVAVKWFADANGKAGSDILVKNKLPFEARSPNGDTPNLILVGTSASANGLQVAWTRYGRERGIPVGWLEDLWGTGERLNSRSVDPDFMLVNDDVAAMIAKNVRPNLITIVVGKASFENLIPLIKRKEEIRQLVRNKMKLYPMDYLVTYWSGGEQPHRVDIHLTALAHILNENLLYLAVRLHPKLPEQFKSEQMARLRATKIKLVDASDITPAELNIASNVVVADWSGTEGYASMLVGTPTVITMFPSDQDRLQNVGYIDELPPMLKAGSAFAAYSATNLQDSIFTIVGDEYGVRDKFDKNREPFLPILNPGASGRVADAVMDRIKKA